jgi:hypothetical protein
MGFVYSFEKLEVWKESKILSKMVYKFTVGFTDYERFWSLFDRNFLKYTPKTKSFPLKTAKISYLYMLYLQYEKMDFDMGMFGASFCHCTSTRRIL